MRKQVLFVLLLVVSANFLHAQDSNTMYLKTDTSARPEWKDYIVLKNGVMTIFKKGDSSVMTEPKTLKDGTIVKQDGTIIHKNNQQEKLGDGEGIYSDGARFKRKHTTKNN
jgi:hypothetical protein